MSSGLISEMMPSREMLVSSPEIALDLLKTYSWISTFRMFFCEKFYHRNHSRIRPTCLIIFVSLVIGQYFASGILFIFSGKSGDGKQG